MIRDDSVKDIKKQENIEIKRFLIFNGLNKSFES